MDHPAPAFAPTAPPSSAFLGSPARAWERLFVNGREVGSKPASGAISSYATSLTLGAYENLAKTSAYVFPGALDEVAVFGRALSASELQAHYTASGR